MDNRKITNISLDDLWMDEMFNSRDEIPFTQVIDLARSIQSDGLFQPIIVMPCEREGRKYKVVAGHRRTKSFMMLRNDEPDKFDRIDAIIREDLDEKKARLLNLNENLARKDLNILEEAKSLQPLMGLGMTEEEIASSLPSASRGWVQVRLMLLKLPKEVHDEAAAGMLSQTQIRDLYSMRRKGAEDEELYETVRRIKDAKLRGTKYKASRNRKDKKTPSSTKHTRSRKELFVMIDHILKSGLEGTVSRALAWAAGEISDLDFFVDLKEFADTEGKEYEIPKNGLDYEIKV